MTASPCRLWVFNPGHEEALLAPASFRYTLSKEIRQMRHELAPLLALLADPSDLLYIPPSADGSQPATLRTASGRLLGAEELPPRLQVELWGRDPHILRELTECPLFRQTTLLLPTITPTFLRLSHRQASTALLSYLIQEEGYPASLLPHWIVAGRDRPATIERLHQAIVAVSQRQAGASDQLLLKRPFTSSGRGVLPLPLPPQAKHLDALAGSILRTGSCSIEPFLQVRDNWAIEYRREASGEICFFALSHFETLASGRAYAGNLLASPAKLWQQLSAQLKPGQLERLIQRQTAWLTEALRDSDYTGYIGIDLFLYEEAGQLLLHPAVEINLRTTMGVLAHQAYLRYGKADEAGRFLLEYRHGQVPAFIASLQQAEEIRILSLPQQPLLQGKGGGRCDFAIFPNLG